MIPDLSLPQWITVLLVAWTGGCALFVAFFAWLTRNPRTVPFPWEDSCPEP